MAFLGVQTKVPIVMKDGQDSTNINIKFNNIHDFHPDNLAENIPMLKNLKTRLNLFKDLKRKLLANGNTMKMVLSAIKDDSLKKLISSTPTPSSSENNDSKSPKPKK